MNKYFISLLFICMSVPLSMYASDDHQTANVGLETLFATKEVLLDSVRKKDSCKKFCNLWIRNCLRAAALKVDGNVLVGGDVTVNGTITAKTAPACIFEGGSNGQVLLGVTNGIPVFSTLTSPNDSVTFSPGAGSLGMKLNPFYGNIARVDQIYGNDTGPDAGSVNGKPFLTLGAALTHAGAYATPTTPVVVWVFPGTYNESITIPNNVSLVGLSAGGAAGVGGVTIQQVNAATTLVTMGQNSFIENVNLQLTGTASLTGIAIPTGPATIKCIKLNVSNGTPTTTYGILVSGDTTIDSSIINSNAFGIYVDAAVSGTISNSIVTSSGGIALETNNAGALFIANASTLNGATADISQTLGTITLEDTRLFNSTANGLNFTSTISPSTLTWASTGTVLTNANPNYMVPGTGAVATTTAAGFGYVIPQQLVVRNLQVKALTGPGGVTTTFTLYKNGAAILPVTLSASMTGTGSQTVEDLTHSVTCAPGDVLSMQIDNPLTSTLANVMVGVEVY